jgi:hypothetical protein
MFYYPTYQTSQEKHGVLLELTAGDIPAMPPMVSQNPMERCGKGDFRDVTEDYTPNGFQQKL